MRGDWWAAVDRGEVASNVCWIYPAARHRGLPNRHPHDCPEVPRPDPPARARTAPGPYPPDLSRFTFRGTSSRRFLAYSSSSRLPDPPHLAMLTRPGVVRAAPPSPASPGSGCPQLHRPCYDRPGGEGLSPPLKSSAPRGHADPDTYPRHRRASPRTWGRPTP